MSSSAFTNKNYEQEADQPAPKIQTIPTMCF